MAGDLVVPGREVTFADNELIVSKTDLQGRITYCNDVFVRVSGYREADLLGKPHNLIRHAAMPRTIFRLLWETIGRGEEIFAYVVNRCKNGDHYWVLAHVTPDCAADGSPIGYHSNRRVARREALAAIRPLYARLAEAEAGAADRKAGLEAGGALLESILAEKGKSYEQFVLEL